MAYIKKVWKDYPDTTTPILASDMNNIENGLEAVDNGIENIENGIEELDTRLNDEEMYVQATAGANGDFFVNLTNQTLVNGRIVKISFPSSTNSSANARLSIDNGSNYKNVFIGALQSLAKSIQGRLLQLRYDGTQFVIDSLEVFSTTELKTKKISTDGKPIYRRTFTGNMPNTQNCWVDLVKLNSNVSDITSITGILDNTATDHRILNCNTYESTTYNSSFSYLGSTDYLQVKLAGWTYASFGFTYKVTLEYTKTTD